MATTPDVLAAPPAAPSAPAPSTPALSAPPPTGAPQSAQDMLLAALSAPPTPAAAPAAPAPSPVPSVPASVPVTPGAPAPAQPVAPGAPDAAPTPAADAAPAAPAVAPIEEFDFDHPDAPSKPAEAQPPTPDAQQTTTEPAKPEGLQPGDPLADPAAQALLQAIESGDRRANDLVERAFLRTNHGREVLSTSKALRELKLPPEQGGIGRFPTVEEIRSGETARMQMDALFHEYQTNPDNWVANFFGSVNPQTGQPTFRPGVDQIVSKLPQHLLQTDRSGALYSALFSGALRPFLDGWYERAQSMPQFSREEADQKTRLVDALQVVEHLVYGAARPLNGSAPANGQGAAQPAAADPLAAERARLDQERRQFQEQQNRTFSQAAQQRESAIYGDIESSVKSDVNALFESRGVRSAVESVLGPAAYDSYVDTFLQQVLVRTSGNPQAGTQPMNPYGFQSFRHQLEQAARLGQMDRSLPVKTYRDMARHTIRQLASQYLSDVLSKLQTANGARHQQAAQSASRTEAPPATNGQTTAPPAQPSPASNGRPRDVDPVEYNKSLLEQTLAMASAIRR